MRRQLKGSGNASKKLLPAIRETAADLIGSVLREGKNILPTARGVRRCEVGRVKI